MIVELTTAGIPWRRIQNMTELGEQKRRVHALEEVMLRDLFKGCPVEYGGNLFYLLKNHKHFFRNPPKCHCAGLL